MDLQQYFTQTEGLGVLSTADAGGAVNSALYARPHFFDDGTIGFIMPDRLTHQNLQANGRAVFLFREEGGKRDRGYKGKRLYLRKVCEDQDQERIAELRRRSYEDDRDGRYLVLFEVEKELPLVGPGEADADLT